MYAAHTLCIYKINVSGEYFSDSFEFYALPIVNKNILSVIDRIKPVEVLEIYENFYNDRKVLYKKYKMDSSYRTPKIYVIINKLNGKCYVGSTRSLRHRVIAYFNLALLATQKSRPISSAILKYGLVNFAFVIIENVDTNMYNIEERETYWIKRLKPEYNATKEAARNIGASHTDATKLVISKKKSTGSVYIYNEFKELLAIAPSLISIAILLGSKSISVSIKRLLKMDYFIDLRTIFL